jgi:hypothetical protein
VTTRVRLGLLGAHTLLAACGSVYDTNQTAPSAWVATYNVPTTQSGDENDAPGEASPRGAAPNGASEARLREAQQLREDGMISDEEYQQLRERILDSL